jgi:hypothetical protein
MGASKQQKDLNLPFKLKVKTGDEITHYLEIFLVLLALGYVLEFVVIGSIRLSYSYELEWIEGAKFDEMYRIFEGQSIYTIPSIFFIPLSYTPLFFYLSAGLMRITGVGFIAPRLISILSTTGSFLLLYALVRKETGRHSMGIIAAGIYAACYQFTGTWMDMAKVDPLFLFLVLASFFFSQEPYRWWKLITGGILFAAAFFTKQVAFPVFLVFAPISLIVTKGKTWLQWLTALVVGTLIFGALEITSNGWFSFFCVRSIMHHPLGSGWLDFWKSLMVKTWPAILLALIYVITVVLDTLKHRRCSSRITWQYLGFAAALIAGSWINTLKIWSYKNTFLPACMSLALLSGLGFRIDVNVRIKTGNTVRNFPLLHSVFLVLLFTQFYLLYYHPFELIPTPRERQAAQAIIKRLSELPGEVLVFNHGFVNHMAGKTAYLHNSALGDILVAKPSPGSDAFKKREGAIHLLDQALSEQTFDWIVLDTPETSWAPYYIYSSKFIEDNGALYPGRGESMVPKSLMVRNPVARGGAFPLDDPILDYHFQEGWGKRETWGRWAIGSSSILSVILEKGPDYTIDIVAAPFCDQDLPATQSVQILWNGETIGNHVFDTCENQSLEFSLDKDLVKNETNELRFIFEINPSSSKPSTNASSSNSPSVGFSLIQFTQN